MASRAHRSDPALPTCDDSPIWYLMLSWNHFPTLVAADEFGLFSLLENEPKSEDAICRSLSIGARACEAMLGVLVARGFLAKWQDYFYLTDLSRNYLLPESPYYWGGMLALLRDLPMSGATVRDAAQKDKRPSVFSAAEDKALTEDWAGGDLDSDKARAVTRAMHSHSFPAAMGVAQWGEFDDVRHMLDVGGGSGCFCIALAMRYPDIRFTVMELPAVCAVANEYIAEYGLQARIDTYRADMFQGAWPAGYDAVFLSNVLHDWDQLGCERLVRNAFDALPSGGRIYAHELLLDDTKTGPLLAPSFSIHMLLFAEGKQYTAGELQKLLQQAGFEGMTIKHTYGHYSLVSARKP